MPAQIQFDDTQIQAMKALRLEGITFREIAKRFGVSEGTVLRRLGWCPKKRHRQQPLQNLDQQITAIESQLIELKARKAALAIKFQWQDDTTIVVHGVTELFIASKGLASLRQFIEKNQPQRMPALLSPQP